VPRRDELDQVLGTAIVTVALLVPAIVAPQESWAKACMAVQVVLFAWLVLCRPSSNFLLRLGSMWPARYSVDRRLNSSGVRIAQVLGLVATSAALASALLGWQSACQFLLAVAITSALTNLFLGYCIGCEIAETAQSRKAARRA
jgi:hypothetical protein